MKKCMLWMIAFAAAPGGALFAQNITGTWQGTLEPAQGTQVRVVFKVVLDNDKLKATLYSVDQVEQPIPVSSITKDGSTVKMTITAVNGNYEGKLSADGNAITGSFMIQDGPSLPLNLTRATPETAWAIPEPPLIVGAWKLNADKSNLRVPADHVDIRHYWLRPDGFLVGLLITSDSLGNYHYLQFTAKSDGKDYPEFTETLLADMVAGGKQTPRTYAETVVDEYTTDWTDKVNGKVVSHGKKIISKDGKTLTLTVDGSSQVYIYDRQ